tara:strand:- start:128 stop:346 length:219 start_codon:yes stop_codon:yes gene_type:complete
LGFSANKVEIQEGESRIISNTDLPEDLLLNQKELQTLLKIIKNSSFEGKDIELIFKLTWKLQEAYLSLEQDE